MNNIQELNYPKLDVELSFSEWVEELNTLTEWF